MSPLTVETECLPGDVSDATQFVVSEAENGSSGFGQPGRTGNEEQGIHYSSEWVVDLVCNGRRHAANRGQLLTANERSLCFLESGDVADGQKSDYHLALFVPHQATAITEDQFQ